MNFYVYLASFEFEVLGFDVVLFSILTHHWKSHLQLKNGYKKIKIKIVSLFFVVYFIIGINGMNFVSKQKVVIWPPNLFL